MTRQQASEQHRDPWEILQRLIADLVLAAIAKSWKGGGDPADFDAIEARLATAKRELLHHIAALKRAYEDGIAPQKVNAVGPTCGKDTRHGPCHKDRDHEGECDGFPF